MNMRTPSNAKAMDVLLVGGGMICHDQLLPALYQLQRLGNVGDITVCARSASTVQALAANASLQAAFPGQGFTSIPNDVDDPDAGDPNAYENALGNMEPHSVVLIATPDTLHNDMIHRALNADQHVISVKPLVQRHAEATAIEHLAMEKGLFVGVEYHKRFDRRALVARRDYREGRFGEFRVGEARMIEPWYYRNSNFENWFTCENTDAFTYVGCHYVDQVYFMTGLRPVNVSVLGMKGQFPNGNEGYLWATGRVVFENGGILNVIDGLGYPDDGAGTNDQGITLFCDDGARGAIIKHNDQFRGVEHGYVSAPEDAALFRYVNPDYFKLVPWNGDGLKPVGYGYESVEALVQCAIDVEAAGALDDRRSVIQSIDAQGLIATPANSSINELVTEAARHSILNDGVPVDITYDPAPSVRITG